MFLKVSRARLPYSSIGFTNATAGGCRQLLLRAVVVAVSCCGGEQPRALDEPAQWVKNGKIVQ